MEVNSTVQHQKVQMKGLNCLGGVPCHQVFQLAGSYTKIDIKNMIFSGWKVHSCMYSGVSFLERQNFYKENNKRTYFSGDFHHV